MQEEKLVSYMLDLGEMLLTSGAEVSRVEDTLNRIGKAYLLQKVDIFTITSTIILTVKFSDSNIITQTRRIKKYETNLEQVEYVNQLSRDICVKTLSMNELKKEIDKIRNTNKYNKKLIFLSYVFVSGAFSVFFGGSLMDSIASMITGGVMYFTVNALNKLNINNFVTSLLSSLITALCAVVLNSIGIGENIDKIIIGNIMLLIPGLTLTSSLRDMINGDIISGLLGVLESILKAIAIAMGFAFILIPIGG